MSYPPFDKQLARREYYRQNYIFYGIGLGSFPVMMLLAWVFDFFNLDNASRYVGLAWIFMWLVAGIWRITWKCPRCRKPFYYKWWYHNSFSFHCLHCGLRPGDLQGDFLPKER